ncbi:retrovirus-related pol polyprotein from transposon TNT 1-94 [Tanacetum coccineum]
MLATKLENKFERDNTPIVIKPPCYSASKFKVDKPYIRFQGTNKRFDEYVLRNVFKHSTYDSCIYYRSYAPGEYINLFLYVDDMLIASKSKDEIGSTKSLLRKEFDMNELGEAKKILRMEIVMD